MSNKKGWIICSLQTIQPIVNIIAEYIKNYPPSFCFFIVSYSSAKTICSAAIGYRLEPAHKYPVWLDNAADVTQHVIEDNAGAMTAASLSHTLKNIDFQVLVSPALDTLGETPSYEEFASPMYYVTPEFMECRDDVKDPRVSILRNTTFEGLPETLLLVIEFDFLRNGNLGAFLKACAEAMSSARDFMASI
ncbi:unnamed protein product [Rotaria magnacalcarata]|uniref:Alpha/beta hydrolase fold-3 domain-containing protein n=1 Tax=Rotaria magnacalcarata TaxID=392030 RepID=A0A815AP86_9BILA|nr:unnamed protein product [Rotaria magnacalcarata]